mmetsp:Transcript_22171/g.44299  ORF Transcript_22171/g.44299 Transcript_22171/m.44299 type:complete len:211 (+) Transcript_22171:597-1229(+)
MMHQRIHQHLLWQRPRRIRRTRCHVRRTIARGNTIRPMDIRRVLLGQTQTSSAEGGTTPCRSRRGRSLQKIGIVAEPHDVVGFDTNGIGVHGAVVAGTTGNVGSRSGEQLGETRIESGIGVAAPIVMLHHGEGRSSMVGRGGGIGRMIGFPTSVGGRGGGFESQSPREREEFVFPFGVTVVIVVGVIATGASTTATDRSSSSIQRRRATG